jgi:hypothetical protein
MGTITPLHDFRLRQVTGILLIAMSIPILHIYFSYGWISDLIYVYYFSYNILLLCLGVYLLTKKEIKQKLFLENLKYLKIIGILMIINGLYTLYEFSGILLYIDFLGLHYLLKVLLFLILGAFLIKNKQWSVIGGVLISLDGPLILIYLKESYFSFPNFISSIILACLLIGIMYTKSKKKINKNVLKEMKEKLNEDYVEDRISREEYLKRKKEFEK